MISEIRKRVQENGRAEISIDEYNQLQKEWITRCGSAELLTEIANEAADRLEEWGAYVPDYFKEKHGLAEDIKNIKAIKIEG